MVATPAALMRRSYAAGVEAARERKCNDNCDDADREQASEGGFCGSGWSRLSESNRRPTHYECVALAD
jgi:hypothetical protein